MQIFDIAKNYFVIQLKVTSSFIHNYTYIIIDKASQQAAIVDPAWELDKIISSLSTFNVKLTKILLTHSHFDHVNLVNSLLERFSPDVYMSVEEIAFYNFTCRNLNSLSHHDTILLGETPITLLFTPGHTTGGVCYFLSDSLFTGDTIFNEGCGICNAFGGNPEQMFESIQKVKMIDPGVHVFPGHSFGKKPGRTLGQIMKENIYFQIDVKKHFINFRMRRSCNNFFVFR